MSRRILIADDSETVRRVMCDCLEERGDVEVCGQASNGVETIDLAIKLKPDLVILDVLMPALNGIEISSILKKKLPKARIILFTMFGEYVGTNAVAAAGVDIIIPKPEGLPALMQA